MSPAAKRTNQPPKPLKTSKAKKLIGGKKKARCVQEDGRSPGGSRGPWGTRRRKEYPEVLIQGIAVVGHALIGLALLVELALYIVGRL